MDDLRYSKVEWKTFVIIRELIATAFTINENLKISPPQKKEKKKKVGGSHLAVSIYLLFVELIENSLSLKRKAYDRRYYDSSITILFAFTLTQIVIILKFAFLVAFIIECLIFGYDFFKNKGINRQGERKTRFRE